MGDEEAVEALVAKQAIHETLMRYCRGIDRCDVELVRSAYHEDSYDDHGTFKGNGWEFADFVVDALASVPQRTLHLMGNELVDVDGDVAVSESYFVAYHHIDIAAGAPSTLFTFWGRYVDRLERRRGEWRIAHRIVVKEWAETRELTEAMTGAEDPFTNGARDRSDPVYAGR